MDELTFDALTRSVTREMGPRRAVLRLLAGTVIGAITSRLGQAGGVAQASSPRGKSRRTHPAHQRQGQGHAHQQDDQRVRSEGKRKGKSKKGKRHHHSPPAPPLPPGCQHCNECQMCQDGACVSDSALNGVACQGSGAACGYCQGGQCAPSLISPCGDGFCPSRQNRCCADEKLCPDHESPTGIACIPKENCCP